MPSLRRILAPALVLAASAAPAIAAETAPFDLTGPALRVTITRKGTTLPIGQVPQLAEGDEVGVVADLPKDQSAHYLLVSAFLRGSTNPPPNKWFDQAETWTKKGRRGLKLKVPAGAQQIVLFLAPATGGDYPTLRNAVQGRPGAFVRTGQELAQASLDRARLDTYLAAIRRPVPGDADRLERITPLLARSLQVRINADCLTKLPDLQAPCLLQNQESLVMSDGHSNAITDALRGPGVDLALQLSATPQGGLGYYSPYIAAIRDVIGIFSSINTAKYQYIPALGLLDGDRLRLLLNAAPSFHNPKSVLVTALPVVAPVRIPPLQVVDPAPSLCAAGGDALLPINGAPLIYATRYAHDLSLRVALPGGGVAELPAVPDAERGGLAIRVGDRLSGLTSPVEGRLHGRWGFDPFEGPAARFVPATHGAWRIGNRDAGAVTLSGGAAACVSGVTVADRPAAWKRTAADAIAVTLPADVARSGGTIAVAQAGVPSTDRLELAPPPAPARFAASIVARAVRRPAGTPTAAIALDGDEAVPSDATLTFSLRAGAGMRFTGSETIEVATEAGASATLAAGKGLTLADSHVALAAITPAADLGGSAFGPLRARIVRDGTAGAWLPLGTLVRLPKLALQCPSDIAKPCALTGDRLFLLDAVAATASFDPAVPIPEGYPGNMVQVPRPTAGTLYIRLHDEPAVVGRFTAGAEPAP